MELYIPIYDGKNVFNDIVYLVRFSLNLLFCDVVDFVGLRDEVI